MIKNDKKKKQQDKRYILTILIRNYVRYCSLTIDAVDTFGHIFPSKWQLKIYLVFLPFFIIHLTVKWFMTDSEWFTVSLKTPARQASVWNKRPASDGLN